MAKSPIGKSMFDKLSNHQLQQSIYLCDRIGMSQIWQQKTYWQNQGSKVTGFIQVTL